MVRLALLTLLPLTVLATNIDGAILNAKRQDTNSTSGGSSPSTSRNTQSGTSSIPTSEPTTTSSNSVPVVDSTVTRSATNTGGVTTRTSTAVVTNTNSVGSPTGTSTLTSSEVLSYSPTVTSITNRVTLTSTGNNADGVPTTSVYTSDSVTEVTTSALVTATSLPSQGGAGLSDNSKKIIGGVVGGVGGALLIGALAFTAWRIWGKKKNLHDDDLYDPNQQEKLSSSTDNQPFKSTLDQYHQPGPVNTASNF